MARAIWLTIGVLLLNLSAVEAKAQGWEVIECIKKHSDAVSGDDIDVSQIIKQVELTADPNLSITVISCLDITKAQSYESERSTAAVHAGRYIFYNPDWLREVIGKDRIQAIAIFGHEIGHIVRQHFTARSYLQPKEKEMEADEFAGCAVAKLDGDWGKLEELLSRIRKEYDQQYPDRLASLQAAREGFSKCLGMVPPPHPRPKAPAMIAALELGFYLEVGFGQFKRVEPDPRVNYIDGLNGGISLFFEGRDKINPNLSVLGVAPFDFHRRADRNAYNELNTYIHGALRNHDTDEAFRLGSGLGNLADDRFAGPFGPVTDANYNLQKAQTIGHLEALGLSQLAPRMERSVTKNSGGSERVLYEIEELIRQRFGE